jgi:hypothetical protein
MGAIRGFFTTTEVWDMRPISISPAYVVLTLAYSKQGAVAGAVARTSRPVKGRRQSTPSDPSKSSHECGFYELHDAVRHCPMLSI